MLERRTKSGDLQLIEEITARYRREIHRMKFLLDAMQPQGVQRIRKQEDGDEIGSIEAALAGACPRSRIRTHRPWHLQETCGISASITRLPGFDMPLPVGQISSAHRLLQMSRESIFRAPLHPVRSTRAVGDTLSEHP